jgi:hypothetical protein
MGNFSGYFEGASTFLKPKLSRPQQGQLFFRGQKSLGPLKISLEMAHKVICWQNKNHVPHFQNQRFINSYYILVRPYTLNFFDLSLTIVFLIFNTENAPRL